MIIGLDVGTSSVQAVAFADDGTVVATRGEPVATRTPGPGRAEQDPLALRAAVRTALAAVVADLRDAPGGAAAVGAVGVTSALHGLLGVDRDRQPVTPLVTWADARATPQAAALRADVARAAALHRATGTPIHPMSPLTKLAWFAAEDPAIAARARWWLGVKDWVLADLTGELVTERSTASAGGLWDLRSGTWCADALAVAGIDADRLPPVVATTAVLSLAADAAAAVGLPAGLPVVAGAGDGPCANLGVGADRPGVVGLTIGTSAALRVTVTEPTVGDGSLFCYALDDARWVVGGALSTGGSVLTWAARALAGADGGDGGDGSPAGVIDTLLAEAAVVAPGSDGLVMRPDLTAPRAPTWDPSGTATYVGLTAAHGRGHLVRAAMEGVAAQLGEVLHAVEGLGPVHEVRATGGAFRSPLWRTVVEAALDRPIVVVDDTAGTARGAARLARAALGGPGAGGGSGQAGTSAAP